MAKEYRLWDRLADDTEYYEKDDIEKYVEYLEEQGQLLWIGNLAFDVEAMLRPFVCHTSLCLPKSPIKRKVTTKCCCVSYAPRLSTKERERIEEILPALKERFPFLEKQIERADGFYEWDEHYDRLICKTPKDLCVLMTPDDKEFGFFACLIHAYCLENDLNPHYYKPSACVMFPLFILDVENDGENAPTTLVTMHSREVMTLGEDEDNYQDVKCCQANKLAKTPVYIEMKSTLVSMFGEEVWGLLDEALKERQAEDED